MHLGHDLRPLHGGLRTSSVVLYGIKIGLRSPAYLLANQRSTPLSLARAHTEALLGKSDTDPEHDSGCPCCTGHYEAMSIDILIQKG